MIRPVSAARPVDVLRRSSDQIRRAAEILAEISDETALETRDRFPGRVPSGHSPEVEERAAEREATIQRAQRSFASGLRLSQLRDDRFPD